MTVAAVVLIASWAGLFAGALSAPDHTIRGVPAVFVFVGLIGSSLFMAIHALVS